MAQYAIFIYAAAPADRVELTPEESAAHQRHADELIAAGGTMVAAFALEPTTSARSVRPGLVTDGPFIESREVIAGLYVVEAADQRAAVEIAQLNPALAQGAGLEVRRVESGFVAPADGDTLNDH